LPRCVFQFSSGLRLQPWPSAYTFSAFFGISARFDALDVSDGVGLIQPVVLRQRAADT
jgi:hypothetical protein